VIEWGPDFLLSRWSEGAERIFGWRAEEVLGQRLDEFRWVHEDDVAHVAAISAGLLDGSCTRSISHNRNYRKDGSVIHCEWYNSSRVDPSGKCRSILSLVLDITERAQAEEALQQSEARYRSLFESIDDGFCVIELIFDDANRPVDYRFIETNPAFEKHAEFRNAAGKTIRELVPDLEAHWFEVFGRVATTGEPTRYSIGSHALQRWYEGFAFRIGKPEQHRVAILFKDVTEHRRAEEALRESEDRFRSVLENLSEGLILFDQHGNLIYQNPASLRIHGFDPEEDGRISHEELPSTCDVWDETGRPISFEEWPVSRVFRSERFQDQVLRVRRVDTGKEFHGSYNGSPLFDSAGNLVAGFITIRDITQQKRTQDALIRNEKLATVGRMAATVAHEINNPLAAVMNAIFIARSGIDKPATALEALNLADEELRRIAHLTRQTLGFYRESTAPAKLLLCEIADSAIDLLANKIRTKSAKVVTRYCENTQIIGIAGELRQVLSNLLANSLDAVDANGTILLRVSRTQICGREQLRITIADDGPGIPRTIRAHIFEPFFTTKEAVGTGLGLWVSRQIVEKHGGSIRVHSSISGAQRGTTFSILLPANAAESACTGS
jgi:PAS domain S-box-containing protein